MKTTRRMVRRAVATGAAVVLSAVLTAVLTGCTGCSGRAQGGGNDGEDQHLEEQFNALIEEPEELLALIDSLERAEQVEAPLANAIRGRTYYDLEQLRNAEFYLKRALDDDDGEWLRKQWPERYYKATTDIASLLSTKGDMDGQLAYALRGYEKARTDTSVMARSYQLRLLGQIANCQLWLGRKDEAQRNFNTVYSEMLRRARQSHSFYEADNLAGEINNIIVEHNNARLFKQAELWVDRMAEAVEMVKTADQNDAKDIQTDQRIDELTAREAVNRAIVYAETGRRAEARQAYKRFLESDYANTDNGLLDKAVYYESAGLWVEAADLQPRLDSLDRAQGVPLTMDYLKSNLGSRFNTEYRSGRIQAALQTAVRIVELLDSADHLQRQSDAQELATIYETQEKEAKIAEQQNELSNQRNIGLLVALVLVTAFFTLYTLNRRRASRRLQAAHAELQTAYGQLEATTTAKERIESELRIARDIQMSMVPSQFPERKGLDMYALMTPAREVGGDLYNYVLDGDRLYFCVGDVSGKGVPASLFMAQATRLFRTLATQGMMPADICNSLNEALSGEDNVNGMFITMFIGLADLRTGHLDFCNAGHNPPVIGGGEAQGEFLQMEPNAPIGLWPELTFVGEQIESIKGRPLFIYTDGLNEAENGRQEQFGEERLMGILRTTRYETARQVVERLAAEVDRHREGAEPNDDLTMMCVRVGL